MEKYMMLMFAALFMMSGDCQDFKIWLIWQAAWACVVAYSMYRIWRIEHE